MLLPALIAKMVLAFLKHPDKQQNEEPEKNPRLPKSPLNIHPMHFGLLIFTKSETHSVPIAGAMIYFQAAKIHPVKSKP
jgi:hypothetical protein